MQFIGALSCVPLEALLCSPAPSSFFCGPHGSKSGHFTQSEELISKNRRYFALSSPNPPSKSTNHPLTLQSTLGTANSLVRPPSLCNQPCKDGSNISQKSRVRKQGENSTKGGLGLCSLSTHRHLQSHTWYWLWWMTSSLWSITPKMSISWAIPWSCYSCLLSSENKVKAREMYNQLSSVSPRLQNVSYHRNFWPDPTTLRKR